ncbi:MAG TPA: efflux RND transporter periplasmic adaptor subunit [Gammaproteobacteria bacterium]
MTTIRNTRALLPRKSAAAIALGLGLLGTQASAQTVVRVAEPARRDFELVTTQPGTAEAFYEADLGANVSGYVSELLVDIGDRVKAGQVLARITVPELIQARNAAAAEVAADESEHERISMLAERNSVTQRALTEAKSRLDAARAKQAEIEAQMAYATIEAPFDGVVTARTIDPGDMVYQASSPKGSDQPLLRVAKVDVIRLKTYIPERESAWVDIGDAATIAFDALAGRVFIGQVARTAQALDPATRTLLVEIDLPNAEGRIRPGYYGRARIVLESSRNALAIPSTAVRFDGGEPFVFTVGAGDSARRTPIEIGLQSAGWTEVTSGLSGNERVVTGGVDGLTDGATVLIAAQ